jgi:hypothetical protein
VSACLHPGRPNCSMELCSNHVPLCPATSTTALSAAIIRCARGIVCSVNAVTATGRLHQRQKSCHAKRIMPAKALGWSMNAYAQWWQGEENSIWYGAKDLSEISSMCRAVGQRTRTHCHLLMYVSAIATLSCSPYAPEHGVVSIKVVICKADNILAKIAVCCG